MVSTFAAALLAALGLSGPSATHAAPPSGATFFVSGHGWGHGVGLAQYGAYGYALHGWTVRRHRRALLPGNRARPGAGEARARAARARLEERRRLLALAVHRARRARARRTSCRPASSSSGPGLKLKLAASSTKALPGAARLLARHGAARPRRPRLPRHAARDRRQGGARRERRRPRVVPLGRRAERDARHAGPPRRSSRRRSWPAPTRSTHLQGGGDFDVYPDTRSQVYGGIAAESRLGARGGQRRPPARSCSTRASSPRPSSSRARAAARRTSRTSGRLEADAVPRLGAGPLRHALAVPRLGPAQVQRAAARQAARLARDAARRAHRRGRRRAACAR